MTEFAESPGFMNGFWLFVGLVGGTVVNLLTYWLASIVGRKKLKRHLVFELNYNKELVSTWRAKLSELRIRMGTQAQDTFFYYFRLTDSLKFVQARLAQDAKLYDFLAAVDLTLLNEASQALNQFYEQKLNEDITSIREGQLQGKDANAKLDFWDKKLEESESGLAKLIAAIRGR